MPQPPNKEDNLSIAPVDTESQSQEVHDQNGKKIAFQVKNGERSKTSRSGLNLKRAASVEASEFGSEKNKFDAKTTLFMAFSSLGSIYGDIGTSPLYTLATIFSDAKTVDESEVLGGVSCVFWLFTIVVILKYISVVLIWGPYKGEGGQIAIYTKIATALSIGPGAQNQEVQGDHISDTEFLLSRTRTSESYYQQSKFISKYLSKFILFLCFFGCSLVISDGLLTPTTSVLSAVEGIKVQAPSIHSAVLPISCVVLVFLFAIQRFGSGKVSLVFAPIIAIWLALLAGTGVYNITLHPAILKAFSPVIAVKYLVKRGGINVLGSVMLCITGTEAMFADIGHFGRLPVQLTLVSYVYPCLMMAYFGQGAYLIKNPHMASTVFYASIPGGKGLFWVVFVLAIAATIIASQALILGVFSILRQLIQIDCFPNFKIVHSSKSHYGQVYIPTINFLLMIGVILTTVGYGKSAKVSAAYGLGVSLDFLVTTILITIAMIYVYKFHFIVPLCFFLAFGTVDMLLIISNMKKIVHGAWFPLVMCILFTAFILFWYWGRSAIKENFEHPVLLEGRYNDNEDESNKRNYETITFIYTKNINITPDFIINSMDSIMIFVNISVKAVPYLGPFYDDINIIRVAPGIYKASVNFGFMDELVVDTVVLEKLIRELNEEDISGLSQLDDVDIVHIIESEKVRAKRNFYFYAGDSNTIMGRIMGKWYGLCNVIRKYVIEYVFSTIHDLFNSNDILDNELVLGEGEIDVIYLGSIVRI